MALAKWYKVDFHTHTPESRCFTDKTVTEREWLGAAKDSGMNVVVITDHNSVGYIRKIDNVKVEYESAEFKVFYGIELCVSADFTHIIVIFDDKLSVTEIEDAIISCLQLKRGDWANTEINVSEDRLKDLCNEMGDRIFIIPAHFASNKGLGKSNLNELKKYQEFLEFSAIEVRNEEDVNEYNNKVLGKAINKAVLITGSDNPSMKDEAQHSVEGIGNKFTWVKLSSLSFEGLRQVFIDPEHRCINWLDLQKIGVDFNPNEVTYNYISGISFSGISHMTDMSMRFSPNLNCIVGGRGTGKSTIVDAINYGVCNEKDLSKCKLLDKTLSKDGKIVTYFNFGINKEYQIEAIRKGKTLETIIRDETGEIDNPPEFKLDFYGQKEIFSLIEDDDNIANQGKSPLVKMIDDKLGAEFYRCSDDIDDVIMEMLRLSDEYKSNKKRIRELPTVKAEMEKGEAILNKFKASGIEEVRAKYEAMDSKVKRIEHHIDSVRNLFENEIVQIQSNLEEIDVESEELGTDNNNSREIVALQSVVEIGRGLILEIQKRKNKLEEVKKTYEQSGAYSERDTMYQKYMDALVEVRNTGGEDIHVLQNQLQGNRTRYNDLLKVQGYQEELLLKIQKCIDLFVEKRLELTEKRIQMIKELNFDNIAIDIIPLGHLSRWKLNLQKEFGKENMYDTDFQNLVEGVLNGEKDYCVYKEYIRFLLTSDDGEIWEICPECTNNRFLNIWRDKQKNDTLSAVVKVIPEDKINIKIVEESGEIDINEGSPGQKSAAILAFILNSGDNPLIIDQPEDDLDNSLIYNLVVKSIRKMKNKRQIIIVTHNPNIPVLGDAEGILVLERDAEGKVTFRKGKKTGCIEEKVIREGICDIMEGGEEAFRKRERKYQY